MKKIVFIALAAIACSACGKKSKAVAANVRETFKDPALVGSWQSDNCNTEFGKSIIEGAKVLTEQAAPGKALEVATNPISSRVEYKFSPGSVIRKVVWYRSSKCEGAELVRFEESGNILKIETDPNKRVDGGTAIDLDLNKLTVTALGDDGVKFANNIKLCGFADWQKDGKGKGATDRSQDETCYGIKVPRKIFNLYRIEGKDKLFLGIDPVTGNGNRPEERPDSVTPKTGAAKLTEKVVKFNKK